jgi:hypothetical protein
MTAVVELCEIFLYKLLTFELILGIEDIRWATGRLAFPTAAREPCAHLRRSRDQWTGRACANGKR